MFSLKVEIAKTIGSQTELAYRLGVSPQRVQRWTKYRVPAEWVIPVEKETGIPRSLMRPDIYPAGK